MNLHQQARRSDSKQEHPDPLPLALTKESRHQGRSQLITLLQAGLNPDSKLLDIGCGWLRGGYWFIHFLNPGGYFGIEPWEERLRVGSEHIVPADVMEAKAPCFSSNEDYDFAAFGQPTFDFFFASSIWSHCSKKAIAR